MTTEPTTDPLAVARATNQRLNLRAQQLESELATYRRAVADWEISDRGTYVPLRTLAAIAKAAGVAVPERWELHYERVERAEAALAAVAAGPSAPTNQTALRKQIAAALWEANGPAAAEDANVAAVLAVLPPTADLAAVEEQIQLRDYWHAEAMSATARIIELEAQAEELRREPAVVPVPVPAPTDRAARAQRYGQVLRRWGLLDEVNDPKAAEEFAVNDLLAVADAEQVQLRRERDLAIAHDRQPYPTAWAYEQACAALRRKTGAIERVQALHVPDGNGECRGCGHSFDPCPTIAALDGDEAQQPETQADGPTAEELAGHLAAQRMSVLQCAFRILGWRLRFALVDDEQPAVASQPGKDT